MIKTELMDHQIDAVNKLRKLKVGALYMEMGTGKTRTALELLNIRLSRGRVKKCLWFCPCSVKRNLEIDIMKHAPEMLKYINIVGIQSISQSNRIYLEVLDYVKDGDAFLIVDESSLVKNHKALRSQRMHAISTKCEYKLILNGTPVSKSHLDLFSQWYILDWRILGYMSFWSFAANHLEYDEVVPGKIRNVLNTDYLVAKISPYTYQVKKDECLSLPDKTYSRVYYELTEQQSEHYAAIASRLMFDVDEMKPYTIYRLFSGLQNVISGLNVIITKDDEMVTEPLFDDPRDNPRIEALMDQISMLDEKAIIFCKYTHEIETITKLINEEYGEGTAIEFYGKLSQKSRQENLKKFEEESQFLVANKTCGGFGLNLQFCSYVIYYNNDWDYATRAQSEDRVHRIGQTSNVHYVDICADDTLDKRILNCLEKKEDLVANFKDELESRKDDKQEFVDLFIYRKNYRGRMRKQGSKTSRIETYQDLKEV